MPPAPDRPLEPSALHRAFESVRPLDWGDHPSSAADLARVHGTAAAVRSLWLLEQAVAVEPEVTAQFLSALPSGTAPYQLSRRVKSPESLARKIRDWQDANRPFPIDDLMRYTVLTETPDDLVAAARRTVDGLNDHGWRATYAMHSYTEGSRYKGIHALFKRPGLARVEVQFHSVASAKVKEATTRWYEIERSASATPDERTQARWQCVELSAALVQPPGIDGLTRLGGRRVAVNNYSDSRSPAPMQEHVLSGAERQAPRSTTLDRNDGITR